MPDAAQGKFKEKNKCSYYTTKSWACQAFFRVWCELWGRGLDEALADFGAGEIHEGYDDDDKENDDACLVILELSDVIEEQLSDAAAAD